MLSNINFKNFKNLYKSNSLANNIFSYSNHFQYINSSSQLASLELNNTLFTLLSRHTPYYSDLIFFCIGEDTSSYDMLGPLVGYKLSKFPMHKKIFIYGTLEQPIYSKNLSSSINNIYIKHNNPLIVAIDSSYCPKEKQSLINYINIGEGSIKPKSNMPYVGDIFITGIINDNTSTKHANRLFNIMRMADIISSSIWNYNNNIL